MLEPLVAVIGGAAELVGHGIGKIARKLGCPEAKIQKASEYLLWVLLGFIATFLFILTSIYS